MGIPHYDDLGINEDMLLDLPYREATGTITQDVASPHHPIILVNTPTWATLGSGLGVLEFNGTTEYAQCATADCADLNFTSGDYSIGAWIKWSAGDDSQIVIGRYQVSNDGWEVYLYSTGLLTLRHHHAAGASARTACYSDGWTYDTWHFMGISRSGAAAMFYRNGVALTTTCSVGGLIDPETNTNDLVIGVRTTKNDNYFKGQMYRPRIWDRAVTAAEWLQIYEQEDGWFA